VALLLVFPDIKIYRIEKIVSCGDDDDDDSYMEDQLVPIRAIESIREIKQTITETNIEVKLGIAQKLVSATKVTSRAMMDLARP